MNVMVYCARNHMDAVLKKIEDRLADPALEANPHRGKNRQELQAVLWSRVEKEFGRHLTEHSGDIRELADHAFVFGEALNDTIFMLTSVSSAAGASTQHTFDAGPLPPDPSERLRLEDLTIKPRDQTPLMFATSSGRHGNTLTVLRSVQPSRP